MKVIYYYFGKSEIEGIQNTLFRYMFKIARYISNMQRET